MNSGSSWRIWLALSIITTKMTSDVLTKMPPATASPKAYQKRLTPRPAGSPCPGPSPARPRPRRRTVCGAGYRCAHRSPAPQTVRRRGRGRAGDGPGHGLPAGRGVRRFWYAFGLAVAGGIFVSTSLVIFVVMIDNANQIRQLEPEFIGLFAEALQTGAMRELPIAYLMAAEGCDAIGRVVQRAVEPQAGLLIVAALFALPIGLLTGVFIGRSVARSYTAMAAAVRRVAAGDLSARAELRDP